MLIYILHNNYKNDSINKLYVVVATSSTSNEVETSYIYTLTKDSHKASCWSTENHKSIRDLKEVISCIIKNGIFDQFVIKTVDEILGVQYWKFDLDSIYDVEKKMVDGFMYNSREEFWQSMSCDEDFIIGDYLKNTQ